MLPILEPMRALLATHSHAFATCWKIERRDEVVLRFTDHDTAITLDGDEYLPAGGVNASARQRSGQLQPTNLQFVGILNHDSVTIDDLAAGLYREAKVTEYVIDYRYPWVGKFCTTIYWVEDTQYNGRQWTASLSGLTRQLNPQVGRVFGRLCPYVLGDSKCRKDVTSFTFSATVTSVGTNTRKVLTSTDVDGHAANFFAGGVVTFVTGDNAGVKMEVRESDIAGQLTFYIPLPKAIQVGDTFTVVSGCAHTLTDCRDKYDNVDNHGGFPFIPGNDKMLSYPNAKSG